MDGSPVSSLIREWQRQGHLHHINDVSKCTIEKVGVGVQALSKLRGEIILLIVALISSAN